MKSRLVGLVAATTLAVAGGALGFTQLAFAGKPAIAPLTVVKTVSGPVPAGTTFTATIQCDAEIIYTGDGDVSQATVEFDDTGQPTTADTVSFDGKGSCIVTETADGGAATTTYACEAVVPDLLPDAAPKPSEGPQTQAEVLDPVCTADGPQAEPIAVNVLYEGQEATVTIHNTFVEPTPTPEPAAEVVAAPAFTG